jgi:hypothetical protein
MAAVIYELWRREDRSLLIMPGTLPIEASAVVAELTNYLDEAWTPVIATDVDGENALPLRLDNANPTFGRYSAARRVARTVLMGSAPIQEAANRGLDDRRIKLGCVQPGESPATFGDALRRLANEALFLSTDGQRYWYSLQQTVTRLAADRAGLVRIDDVDEEIRQRLIATGKDRGEFAAVHAAPTGPADVPDEAAARLVILRPEYSHSSKTEESPAREFAVRVLDERAGGPRIHRNLVIFLAPDSARIEELRDAVRNWLAWRSIKRDEESLNLDSVGRAQVETRSREWDEAVTQRIGEAYQWLLVPAGEAGKPDVEWEITRSTGSESLAARASRKLQSEEALLPSYSGARLRIDLDRVPLWRGDYVEVRQLWSDFAQYLYLPRLRDERVLLTAIEDGVSLITWETDAFAFADSWDEGEQRYVGLRVGEQMPVGDLRGILVKPDVARRQLESEGTEPGVEPEEEHEPEVEPEADAKPKRFYGSVTLDSVRAGRDAGEIAESVIQHLSGLPGANVEVRLEIQAEIPEGAPDDVVRTVTENASTLKFDEQGFERD